MSRLAQLAIRGKGARARLKEIKRDQAIARQAEAINRGTDRRNGEPYAFAPLSKFEKRSDDS